MTKNAFILLALLLPFSIKAQKVTVTKVSSTKINPKAIESMTVDQTILGRVFNYGNMHIIGTGSTNEIFEYLENPMEFKKHILNLI